MCLLANALTDLVERFRSLDFRTKNVRVVEEKRDEQDHEKKRMDDIREIARTRSYRESLAPLLWERLEQLEAKMDTVILSHPALAELQGRKSELRGIINLFEKDEGE